MCATHWEWLPSAPASDEGMRLDALLFSFAHPEAPQGRVDPWVNLFISGRGLLGGRDLPQAGTANPGAAVPRGSTSGVLIG